MEIKEIEISSASSDTGTQSGHLYRNAAPISKLHRDTLLEIFQYNANMDDCYPSLDTARYSSQVNTLWRDVILNSPRVWANVIDLDDLEISGEAWREEVIRRSQNCSVHVKGSISIDNMGDLDPWWLQFLNANWTRVRNLDLRIRFGDHCLATYSEYIIEDYLQAAVYRRALPYLARSTLTLENIRLEFPYLCDPLERGATLFNDNAPFLQTFYCQNVRFDTQNSWMSQLRSLHVHQDQDHGPVFQPAELYQILSQAPLLESLSIEEAIYMTRGIDVPQVPIHLPQLRHLNIRAPGAYDPDPHLELLNLIIPRDDCSICAVVYVRFSDDITIHAASRFMSNYFKVHHPTYLKLSADADQFFLSDLRNAPKASDRTIAEMPFLDYAFYGPGFFTNSTFSEIYETLSSASLISVVDLHLHFQSKHDSPSCLQFRQLLLSFSSVETFTTTPGTLQQLSASPMVDFPIVFPRLKVLKMPFATSGYEYETDIPLSVILTSFLTARKEAGVPVLVFEYLCGEYAQKEDLTFLDAVTDLKVTWNIKLIGNGEYICGSGKPEELHFGRKQESARSRNYGI